MQYKYYICDVFTSERFGGNQLAVLPDASGLTDKQMQQIAKEFNFSESTFVFPAKNGNTREVRIFTPAIEVPFAGHPNIGTAFILATSGELGEITNSTEIVFEEKAGIVPITLSKDAHGKISCELKGPEKLSLGATASIEILASALSIDANEIVIDTHLPQVASIGIPFLMVELQSLEVLKRVVVDIGELKKIASQGIMPFIHAYTKSNDEFDLRARMFAPLHGIPEDPATGSANCALGGLLAYYDSLDSGDFEWNISQGDEINRSSFLNVRAKKTDGRVIDTWVGGSSVIVSEGLIYVD